MPATLRIGELSHRTGVGVPTLRAWESRYRLLRPSRTAGGQRLYSADDEARIREVQQMVAEGSSVGAAARWVAQPQRVAPAMPDDEAAPAALLGAAQTSGRSRSLGGSDVAVVAPARLSAPGPDRELLAAVHQTTRAIVHAATPADVVAVLAGFVRQIGASLVDAQIDDAVMPVDLSFGEGPPMLPRAEPFSVTRLNLEQALPALIEDARRLIDLLRRADTRNTGSSVA